MRDDVIFSQSGHDCPLIFCPVIPHPTVLYKIVKFQPISETFVQRLILTPKIFHLTGRQQQQSVEAQAVLHFQEFYIIQELNIFVSEIQLLL